jgi:hypothetical protein
MLSENQVKRLLKQCEKDDKYTTEPMRKGFTAEWNRNKGWIQALRLILEEDTYPIRKDPIDGK